MIWLRRLNFGALLLLGVSTGAVKLAQMQEEMHIFREAGLSDGATMGFGAAQLLAALLLLHPMSRRGGAVALGASFVLATGVLVVNNMWTFAVASLLFIAMAALTASRPALR